MPLPPVNGAVTYPNRIVRYLHCGMCLRANRPNHVEIGMTPDGLQVWCKHCQANVAHFELGPIPIQKCAMCELGIPHVH